MDLQYQTGFCNDFATEALPGALPQVRNSPQRCPYGLYAEQFSGTGFTVPRHSNRRSWLYRIRPAAVHGAYRRVGAHSLVSIFDIGLASPNQLRWSPLPFPAEPVLFVDGLGTSRGAPFLSPPGPRGGPHSTPAQSGCAIHWYVANQSMRKRFFSNSDGEMLIVPQAGRLRIGT